MPKLLVARSKPPKGAPDYVRFAIRLAALSMAALPLAGCSNKLSAGKCVDVTSYDYNWGNDMKCMRADGTIFYTSYDGARSFEANN